jgi:diguanylate cyclase (GGDEF)-like protein
MEDIYKFYFEKAGEPAVVFKAGTILAVNPAFEKIISSEKDQTVGKKIEDLLVIVAGEVELIPGKDEIPEEMIDNEVFIVFKSISDMDFTGKYFYDGELEDGLIIIEIGANTPPDLSADLLTGLPGRAYMEEMLVQALNRRFSDGVDFCVIVADINKLKFFNGNYGRKAGDSIVKYIADKLLEAVRDRDVAGRWKDDDFMIVLNNFNREMCDDVLKRIYNSIHRSISMDFSEFSVPVEVNLGLALPEDGDSVDTIESKCYKALKEQM